MELKSLKPGMMTLAAVPINTDYYYSSVVVFGLTGKMFFCKLVTLVDIMLPGHWIEMLSVMGASKALKELAKLTPSYAHKLVPDRSVKDVPASELSVDDKDLVKPGEKIPADDPESFLSQTFLEVLARCGRSRYRPTRDHRLRSRDSNQGYAWKRRSDTRGAERLE